MPRTAEVGSSAVAERDLGQATVHLAKVGSGVRIPSSAPRDSDAKAPEFTYLSRLPC